MIDGVIHWSLRNRVVVLAAAVVLLSWGAYETVRMPVDVFPDLTAPTVTVLAEAHGMAPEEVETLVTMPIETTLNGSPGVRCVRSSTSVGLSITWVEFEWGADVYQARQIVSEKLQLAKDLLPEEVEGPVLGPISSIMGEIMFIALTSDRHSAFDLRTTADWNVRRRLLAVPGVSQVVSIGGDEKQYQAVLNPVRLAAYGIGSAEVLAALRETNESTSAGFYDASGQEYLIHGRGRIQRPEDIGETVVAVRDGEPVLVRHVADVRIGSALKRGDGAYNGNPGVVLSIQKQPQANTLELTQRLDEVLAGIQKSLPEGMTIHTHIFRQADFIQVAVENLTEALRDGAILVVAILFAFLVSFRPTVITVLAIPLSLLAAVLAMKAVGATINTMTLGGMAIAVGALVDDAIIDVENVLRRLRENAKLSPEDRRSAFRVVYEGSKEVRGSIVFATVTIVLVFLPLFFLSGVEGRLLRPLGFAYIVSLGASLVVALTITPVLCRILLVGDKVLDRPDEGRVVRTLKRFYAPVLDFCLPRWRAVAGIALVALAAAGASTALIGRSFLPDFNEGALTISAVTLPGTSLAQSSARAAGVERALSKQPEVVSFARRTGRAEADEHGSGVNSSELEVGLEMKDRSKRSFLTALRREFSRVPGMNVVIGQPISHRIDHMLSGTRANVAVKVFGESLYELRRVAEQVKQVMEGVPGVVDLSIEQQSDIPILAIRFNRANIARYGLRIHDVAEAVETAFAGQTVSRVLEGQASFDLVVRYDRSVLEELDTIRGLLVTTPSGAQIPLHSLASIERTQGPNTISRENVQRKIVVMCNVAGGDLSGVVEEIRRRVDAAVELPTGFHIEYGGQFESAEQASRTLFLLSAVVVVGIYAILLVAFDSARDAALVMLNLPLALIGGVAGIFMSGGVLSVASIIGFISLFGIATRNGIMMISHIQHLIAEEGVEDVKEAVRRGAMERLSPILMTALATALALIPLALSGGEPGTEIQTPMAMVILCGLTTSTVLNMIVVPALYLRFGAARPVTAPLP